jgi:hypothetical protein
MMHRFGIVKSLLAALASVTGITVATNSSTPQESIVPSRPQTSVAEDATLAVINKDGEHIGSAVSFQRKDGMHWAVTNQHVVADHASVCLMSRSGKSYPFSIIQLPLDKRHPMHMDIAFLKAPLETTTGLTTAELQEMKSSQSLTFPIVVATGYPTSAQAKGQMPPLHMSTGLLVPLIKSELEEGYDTTYTAPVEKGMSGGGVFVDERLVAINGAHSDPLWDFHWKDRYGKPIDASLNEKLGLLSIGISVSTILREFKRVEGRNVTAVNIDCRKENAAKNS